MLATTVTTNTDFVRSVDRDIIRQIADINRRGASMLRTALQQNTQALPKAVESLRELWLALEPTALSSFADAPYLLFEIALEDSAVKPLKTASRADASTDPVSTEWDDLAARAAYARLLCHFSWHTSRMRPAAASLLLGLSPAGCRAFSALELPAVEDLAASAGSRVNLRWADDERFWRLRLTAAISGEREGLWRSTLAGVQRLAAVTRTA